MLSDVRSLFPYIVGLVLLGALAWAVSFGTLPPAEFTFINGTEVQSVDPAIVTGQPEGRIVNALFECLYRALPKVDDPQNLEPKPGAAESCEISADGRTYTFTMRKNARWSDGTPVTAEDFAWSWRRFLHPETPCEYAYQLYYVVNAKRFNTGDIAIGDKVEVELANRKDPLQLFPQGDILHGTLKNIKMPAEPKLPDDLDEEARGRRMADWKRNWVYVVEIDGKERRFSQEARGDGIEQSLHVLLDFSEVGIKAVDPQTLVVTLNNPTAYFLDLVAFYPLAPVNRACIEKHGSPNWTKAQNIVGNGPFKMEFRRIRDRIRLAKNPMYWGADNVQLNTIDALAVNSETTQLNMYLNGQTDWATSVPNTVIPDLMKRDDFVTGDFLATYFYRVNVTRPPLNDPRVRMALNLAINKAIICEQITRGGQVPARSLVPPILSEYRGSFTGEFNLELAKKLLAEAGYPGGKGMRKIQILYNTNEGHQDIAQVIQQQWKNGLGIDVEPRNLEWGVFLDTTKQLDFDVARAGWIGDYPDANTFLDMFVTGGGNNQTGWGMKVYDELLEQAGAEPDKKLRLRMLHDAEAILMNNWNEVEDEKLKAELVAIRQKDPLAGGLPILPIYSYVSINMVRSYVRGVPPYEKYTTKQFFPNAQDIHPLELFRIDQDEKDRVLRAEGLR